MEYRNAFGVKVIFRALISDNRQTNCCIEMGHIAKSCPAEEALEDVEKTVMKCKNCDQLGHRVRNCPMPRVDRFACRNCK